MTGLLLECQLQLALRCLKKPLKINRLSRSTACLYVVCREFQKKNENRRKKSVLVLRMLRRTSESFSHRLPRGHSTEEVKEGERKKKAIIPLLFFPSLFQNFCSSITGFPLCAYFMMGKHYNLRKRDSKIGINVKIGNKTLFSPKLYCGSRFLYELCNSAGSQQRYMLTQWDLGHTQGEIIDLYLQDLIFLLSLDTRMNLIMENVSHGDVIYSKCIEGWREFQKAPYLWCVIMSFLSHRYMAVIA